MLNSKSIGKKIQKLRNEQNLSQEELANTLFVTRQAVSKWELGQSFPSIEIILELTKVFEVSIEELLCINEKLNIDESNIFKNHDRLFIIKKASENKLGIPLEKIFDQFNDDERALILYNLKINQIKISGEFIKVLTKNERNYWGGMIFL